nr:unnamed protein product [Digitaria exilis]
MGEEGRVGSRWRSISGEGATWGDTRSVLPDLAVVSGERAEVAHLDHGGAEVLPELGWVVGVVLDEVSGVALVELLVGVEQRAPIDEALVVVRVDGGWGVVQ